MELRDKNGLTEAEFLAAYRPGDYPHPSLTADMLVFSHRDGRYRLLLIRRGGHPYLGCLALPGGFCNPDETVERCAARELLEETGVTGVEPELLGIYSAPGRDPRGWIVTAAYTAVVDEADVTVSAGDDAADARWYELSAEPGGGFRLRDGEKEYTFHPDERGMAGGIAFDQAGIIAAAVKRVLP